MFPANIIIIILIDKLNIIVYDNAVTKTKKVNKKTSTAHPLSANNRWASAGRYLIIPHDL